MAAAPLLLINFLKGGYTAKTFLRTITKKVNFRDVWKVLDKLGFVPKNQDGSHIILERPGTKEDPVVRHTTLPRHKTVSRGVLLNIIRDTGLSKKEFLDLL